jgi:hypothetical protein
MTEVSMQVVIPWWLTWIVAPLVMVLEQAGLLSSQRAACIVAWGVRIEAI